jgi:glycosyltransferase involved in cell wall biosynthesis
MKDRPVKGIMIGGGSGIAHLKQRCRQYDIENKVLFPGYVPYEQLPQYLSMIDVCLSTQTNDIVGQVRTTGKLPLYLAAGRFVLASKVGEAAIVLDEKMLVEYEGVKDRNYPEKLRDRIEAIIANPELLNLAAHNVDVARKHFDYAVLTERLAVIIDSVCKTRVSARQIESAKAC